MFVYVQGQTRVTFTADIHIVLFFPAEWMITHFWHLWHQCVVLSEGRGIYFELESGTGAAIKLE